MNFESANKTVAEFTEKRNLADAVIRRLEARKAQLAEELPRLEREYPEVIARCYCDEISRGDLDASRRRIAEIKVELAEIPVGIHKIRELLKPLAEAANPATYYLAECARRRRYIEARDGFIEAGQITDNQANDFLLLATHAGCRNEAEELVNAIVRFAADKRFGIDRGLQFTPKETLLP